MRTLTKLAVLFMMVVATVSCTKDEIITPVVEETNTIVVRVNGETYKMDAAGYVDGLWYDYPDINIEAGAVWLGLPDAEADYPVLRDRADNLTIEVVSYTNDLTEDIVWWAIELALFHALYNHTDLSDFWMGSVLWDGLERGLVGGGNRRFTVIFL